MTQKRNGAKASNRKGLRAIKEKKREEIPAIVREDNDRKNTEIALIENIQREDLNQYEKAQLETLSNSNIDKLILRVISVGKKYEQEMWENTQKDVLNKLLLSLKA